MQSEEKQWIFTLDSSAEISDSNTLLGVQFAPAMSERFW